MTQATALWPVWQSLLSSFAWAFTQPGFRRFAEWITALAINPEEHTITQSVTAIERIADWKALETFAEYGAWQPGSVTTALTRLVEKAPGRIWYGYHVNAADDTKVHRSGEHVWGTCTFHEYTARCPNRAATVRAHNWVVCGALLHNPDKPAWFLPLSGSLYFRKSQLPTESGGTGSKVEFHTKCELAVDLFREQAKIVGGRHLAVFDGGFALKSVVRPLVLPEAKEGETPPRIEFLTRLRHDARLYALPPTERPAGKRGPLPKWGRRLPPPRQGGRWTRWWQDGHAFIYGRRRKVEWKEIVCRWRVSGHEVPVKAVVAKVEGYKKRFTLVGSATELSGLQMVELFCARFRQEVVPRPEAAARLGRVSRVDPQSDRADDPGAVGDSEPVAAVAIPVGRGGVRGLVDAAALEPPERPAERARRGASAAALPAGNPALPVGMAGRWRGSGLKRPGVTLSSLDTSDSLHPPREFPSRTRRMTTVGARRYCARTEILWDISRKLLLNRSLLR